VVGTLLGLLVRSPDAAQGVVFIAVFPLTFVANTFVPVDGLPSVLREFAGYNPISAFAAAFRTLFGNPLALPAHPSWPIQHPVLSSCLWCAGLLAVATPLLLWRFRARTTG
jgi:ABC-2 type transport system permease protein